MKLDFLCKINSSVFPWLMLHLHLYKFYSIAASVKKLCFLPVFWYQCIRTFCSCWTPPVKSLDTVSHGARLWTESFSWSFISCKYWSVSSLSSCFFYNFFFCGGFHFGIEICVILVVWVILLMRHPQGLEAWLRLFQPLLGSSRASQSSTAFHP